MILIERLVIDIVFKITCERQITIEKKKGTLTIKKKGIFTILRKIIV